MPGQGVNRTTPPPRLASISASGTCRSWAGRGTGSQRRGQRDGGGRRWPATVPSPRRRVHSTRRPAWSGAGLGSPVRSTFHVEPAPKVDHRRVVAGSDPPLRRLRRFLAAQAAHVRTAMCGRSRSPSPVLDFEGCRWRRPQRLRAHRDEAQPVGARSTWNIPRWCSRVGNSRWSRHLGSGGRDGSASRGGEAEGRSTWNLSRLRVQVASESDRKPSGRAQRVLAGARVPDVVCRPIRRLPVPAPGGTQPSS
jgi:hypothetical protein